MRTNQTLDEARKYLLYVSDALQAVADSYAPDKQDRELLKKYASDLFDYSTNLELIKNNIISKDQAKRKLQVVAELEYTYDMHKNATAKARKDLHIVQSFLKKAQAEGNERDIEEAKQRVEYYAKRAFVAGQDEAIAKRDLEQGA